MASSPAKRIVIVGATSAIAEHCARLWVRDGPVDLVLVGRDGGRLERVAADLRVRSPQSVIEACTTEFLDAASIAAFVDRIATARPPDIVLIAHGSLPDQASCERDLVQCDAALQINAISPVLFAEAFVPHLLRASGGTLALIGSVAGDRGRRSNYVYGAAKGLMARYAQGLQHRLAGTGVKIVLIKPGPTATPMTAGLVDQRGGMARVDDVAECIVDGILKGRAVVYAPRKWAVIMMVIRHLPAFIFNRLQI